MDRILISGTKGHMDAYQKAIRQIGIESDARYAPKGDVQAYEGLILCGGGDLNPCWYGAENKTSHQIDSVRECSDFYLISQFIEKQKPILGICRGMQILNVALGGTLCQDLRERNAIHQGTGSEDRYHTVTTEEQSLMRRLFGLQTTVNSYHHQSVDQIGRGIRITMVCDDGVPEAFEHTSLPIIAVQWHPERIAAQEGNASGITLFRAFAELIQKSGTV